MALNRQQKRQLERSGDLGDGDDNDDGASDRSAPKRRSTPDAKSSERREPRTSPSQFVKEVRSELRKVAWPTRQETISYSLIVGLALVIMTALIFGFDWVSSEVVLRIFDAK